MRWSRMGWMAGLAVLLPDSGLAQSGTTDSLVVRIQSISVVVPEYEPAKRWYMEKLGFEVTMDEAIPGGGRFLMMAPRGQRDFGLVLQLPVTSTRGEESMPDYTDRIGKVVNVVLRVSDVASYAAQVERNGVELTSRPRSMAWGSQATFRDLYGNTFVIIGPAVSGAR